MLWTRSCYNCGHVLNKEEKRFIRNEHVLCEKCNSIEDLDYCRECGIFWYADDIKCCAWCDRHNVPQSARRCRVCFKLFERDDIFDEDGPEICEKCSGKGYWYCGGCDRYTTGEFELVTTRNGKTRRGCGNCRWMGCGTTGCQRGLDSGCLFINTWSKNDGTYGCAECSQPVKYECGLCRQLVDPKNIKRYRRWERNIHICVGCINRDWMGLIKRLKEN